MNRPICVFTVALTLVAVSVGAFAQTPNISTLYGQLLQSSETNSAARQIAQIAKNDAAARSYLASRVPSVINGDRSENDPVWANAVRLAGQLKIAEAVPALVQALSKPAVAGGYDSTATGVATSTTITKLVYDIVGRALADIGDASIPALARILANGDFDARRRVFWILVNIESPAANQALRDHLPNETNPMMKGGIEHQLGIW
jgi:HEAT repeat protein